MDSQNRTSSLPAGRPRGFTGGTNGTPYILARHLHIGYSNEVVVPDISFELRQGQAVAVIGTNGSGKSTLL